MRPRKDSEEPVFTSKQKPRSLGRIFGYLKTKIKNGIEQLTSITHNQTQNGPEQTVSISSPHSECPLPKIPKIPKPRKQSQRNWNSKPLDITRQYEQLLTMQVQKCYKRVPDKYFRDEYQLGKQLIAKSRKDNKQRQFQLIDFLDEVQFNVAELVAAKQPQVLVALDNMNSMDLELAVLLDHLSSLKKSNRNLKVRLVDKAQRVKNLQIRSNNIEKLVKAASILNRLNQYPRRIKQLMTKDKAQASSLYNEYLSMHDSSKGMCGCVNRSRKGCELANVKEIIRAGYQQTFSKSYWNYITEGLFYQKPALRNIFGNKKDFQSMPGMMPGFSLAALLASGTLDDSICEEEKYELATKQNVQEDIKGLILSGFSLCMFENEALMSNLSQFMEDFQKDFLSDVLTEIKQSFCMQTDNHLVTQTKGLKTLLEQIQPLVQKIKITKFLKVVAFYSDIVQKAIRRSFSVLYRIVKCLQRKNLTKREHIQTSLAEVTLQILGFTDNYLTKLIQLKRIAQDMDLSYFRDIIQVFEDWENFTGEIENYFVKDIFPVSNSISPGMCKLPKMNQLKAKLVAQYFKGLHQNALTKELKNGMEKDDWVQADIDPKYYNVLGYILEGEEFIQDKKRMAMLNSSLYLDKKPSVRGSNNDKFAYFGVTNSEFIIHSRRYRPTSSLLLLLGIIEEYMRINQMDQQMTGEVYLKLAELLHFYNSYLFQLILNTAALHYNKIGNAITIKHLCLSFHALNLLVVLLQSLLHRAEVSPEFNKLVQRMCSHQQQIIKKIQSIIPYKVSQDAKLVILCKPGPSVGTQNIVNYLRSVSDTLLQYFDQPETKRVLTANVLTKYMERILKLKPKNRGEEELLDLEISYFLTETEFLSTLMSGFDQLKEQLLKISSA